MLTINNAANYLKDKIGDNTEIDKVWNAFKSFGRESVQGEEEVALLFQCGVYDFTGEDLFYFDFVRQFDGYSGLEQLHCEFVFAPTDELKKLEAAEWYFDSDGDVDDFYTMVENLKEFTNPLKLTPLKLNIYQEEV
ncbi:MAG: hypothetical protein K0R18_1701 [Bacillales bacterium]|jgi:hypothetical protein|nr:hypothetical protein [Bacillales bacterium]